MSGRDADGYAPVPGPDEDASNPLGDAGEPTAANGVDESLTAPDEGESISAAGEGEPRTAPDEGESITAPGAGAPIAADDADGDAATLVRVIEGLLFLSPDPVPVERIVEATGAGEDAVADAVAELDRQYEPGRRGLIIKRVAGGLTFGTDPVCEPAARALLSTQRIPPLSAAQAETLAIVAYLQPVARPEISRIRGVAADSATATLLERGLIEEAGRSEFGAVLYRTTSLFLRLFGIDSLGALPDVSTWDPAPEEEDELRDRLLRAGGARSGGAGGGPAVELPEPREMGEDPGHVDMPGDRFIDGG